MALAYGSRGEKGAWQMWLPLELTKTNDNHLEQTHLPKSCAINKFAVQTERDIWEEEKREEEEERSETCAWHIYKSLQTAGNCQFAIGQGRANN